MSRRRMQYLQYLQLVHSKPGRMACTPHAIPHLSMTVFQFKCVSCLNWCVAKATHAPTMRKMVVIHAQPGAHRTPSKTGMKRDLSHPVTLGWLKGRRPTGGAKGEPTGEAGRSQDWPAEVLKS